VDGAGELLGIVSESDFLRRSELGTGRRRSSWLQFIMGPGTAAGDFIRERGRKVQDVMTRAPITVAEDTPLEDLVALMEKNGIKRLPVMNGKTVVGIVTRSNLLQAVASFARDIPDASADDEQIRDRIVGTVTATDWSPIVFDATVRDGVVHLHGVISTDGARRAAIVAAENVAGVKEVHDHLCFVDIYSGQYVQAPPGL
jgi:CBS-domain-containing membrane protein